MPQLNLPPAQFERLRLPTIEVDAEDLLRLAWRDPATHLTFRRTAQYRFDSPDGSFGVLYAAFDLHTAFLETVLRAAPQNVWAGEAVVLDYKEVDERRVIALRRTAALPPLRLIRLFDEGLVAAHTDARIASVGDYRTTRRWAKAFHDHPLQADGILYVSRYAGSRFSVVLFDRCAPRIGVANVTPLLEHPQLPAVLDRYQIGIDPP